MLTIRRTEGRIESALKQKAFAVKNEKTPKSKRGLYLLCSEERKAESQRDSTAVGEKFFKNPSQQSKRRKASGFAIFINANDSTKNSGEGDMFWASSNQSFWFLGLIENEM